jgi:putative hydrolase of the HAD superfamily
MQTREKIKNIIFDFGGVILNIDYQKSVDAFKEIGLGNFEKSYSKAAQINLFNELECGLISPEEFRKGLRIVSGKNFSNVEIDYAWNKIILDLPENRVNLMNELKSRYRTFLLSNTNKIHYDLYITKLQKYGYLDFNKIFEKAYFSHEMKMRKPDNETFEFVLQEHLLIPKETLFIDDSIQHIDAAKKLGILTHHLNVKEDITDLFDKEYRLKIDPM